jgi:hypothetical protein
MSKTLDVTRHREADVTLAGAMPSTPLPVIVTNSCSDFSVPALCAWERLVIFDQAAQKSPASEEKQQVPQISECGSSN